MKIGIFYGSSTGRTAGIAEQLAKSFGLGESDVKDVAKASAEDAKNYDVLLLGSSTWGSGELQDDWFSFADALKKVDLAGKKVALFGCGDSSSFPETFCDALSVVRDSIESTGCSFIGSYEPQGYEITDSAVCRDGKFLGLAIDDGDDSKSNERLAAWVALLKGELGV